MYAIRSYYAAELQASIDEQAQSVARSNSEVLRAQLSLAYTQAPFAGVVSKVYVEDGEYVTPGTPLLELRGTGVYEVAVTVPAEFASYVARITSYNVCYTKLLRLIHSRSPKL